MQNDMELRLKITSDGKAAVADVGKVERSIDEVGTSATEATQKVDAMVAALSNTKGHGAVAKYAAELDSAGKHAAQATQRVSEMAAALSRAQSFSSIKLSAGLNEAGRAAAAAKQEISAASVKAAEANKIYSDLINKLTLSAGAYRRQELALQGLNAEQIKHVRQLELQASRESKASIGAIALAGRYFALYQVVQLFGRSVAMTGTLQDIETRTRSLTVTTENYAKAQQFLDNLSIRHHKNIVVLSDSYARILTLERAGIVTGEQGRKILEGFSNVASDTGASTAALEQSLFGMAQGFASGVLHAEELSQVVEPLPGLLQELDKAAGLPAGGFRRLVNAGNVTSAMFRDTLIKALEGYSGAAERTGDNINAQLNDVGNAHIRLATVLEKPLNDVLSPLLREYTRSIDELSDAVDRFVNGPSVEQRIAAIQRSIDAHQNNGAIGSLIDDLLGYDVNLKKNQLDALLKQQAAGVAKKQADDKADAEQQQRAAEQQAANDKRAAAEAIAEESRKKIRVAANKAANEARQEALRIEQRYQALRDAGRSSDQVFIDTVAEYTHAYNTRNISLEQYINLLARADDARDNAVGADAFTQALNQQIDQYKQLTLSAREYFIEQLKGQGLKPEQINQVVGQYDTNKAFEAENKSRDEALKSLEEYSKSLDSIQSKTQQLGDVSSAVFDGALGGVNLLTGAFNNMVSALQDNADALDELNRKQRENAEFIPQNDREAEIKRKNGLKFIAEEKRLNQENTRIALSGVRQVASATAQMFAENTNARRAFNVVALAASVAERAADLAGLGVKAASAVLTQGQGDPYTAFARISAMAAIVGSVLAAAGAGTFQFGGDTTIPGRPDAADSGTVLGDPAAQSESINNTYELLQDIHAREYRELKGINAGISALKTGITDSVTLFFRNGGLAVPEVPGLGKFVNAKTILPTKDPIGQFLLNGLFGTTKKEVTGGGVIVGGNTIGSLLAGGQISGQQFTEITTTKKSWFSKKTTVSELLSAIDPEFQDTLSKIFRGMGTSLLAMAAEFGGDLTDSINNYVIPSLKISLFGLTSEQMIDKLNNILSTQLDNMTSAIFGSLIAQYQKLGEGLFETASRLVVQKAVVLDALDLTGKAFTGDAIAMADGLITLAGGIKEFQAQFQDYYGNFFSEAEQLANTTRRLVLNLSDLDLTLPDTRQAYRDLVEAQELDTAAGRERYDQLIRLSEAADTYYSANEKLRESMKLLSEDTFATALDYKRYLSLASLSGITAATNLLTTADNTFIPTANPAQLLPGIAANPVATAMTTVAQSNDAVADQIRQLRIEQQAHAVAIAQNTEATQKILSRWDGDGLPAERVIA